MNKIILKGKIGRAPKIALTQDGREFASFSLATSTSWKSCPREGGEPEWQTSTDWHHIRVFRESTIGWIKDALCRGDIVYVEGKLTYRHWTDTYGQARLTPHIVVSGFEGKVEYLRSPQSSPRDNELISEKAQDSTSSLTENESVYTPHDEPSLSTQSCLQLFSGQGKEQEDSHNQGKTTYEN